MKLLVVAVLLTVANAINVDNEQDFRAALSDHSVTDMDLTSDLILTLPYWDSSDLLPIIINRSFTVRGPNVTLDQVTRVLDIGYVAGKVMLLPSVDWTIELVILSGAQSHASECP